MMILLKPLIFSKVLTIQCLVCEKIVSRGPFIIVAIENEKVIGFLADTEKNCCGRTFAGPALFEDVETATRHIEKLHAAGSQVLNISPVKPDLEILLDIVGMTVNDLQNVVNQTLKIEAAAN